MKNSKLDDKGKIVGKIELDNKDHMMMNNMLMKKYKNKKKY